MDQCHLGCFVLLERGSMKIACDGGRGVSVTSLDEDKTLIVCFEDRTLRFGITEPLKKALRETLQTKADEGYLHFVFNFQNVSIADSSGIALMLIASNLTASRNTKLYLCHICPVIAGVLNTMRVSKHLPIFDTEEDALAEIRQTG